MRRYWQFLILVGPLFVVACGPGQVAVTAEIDVPDPDNQGATINRGLAELEIQIIPFDRDQVFDSLTQAFGTPEPEIPADLLAAQEEISAAQAEWNELEQAWGNGRARLLEITEEMEPLNPAEAAYNLLFQEFQDVEARVLQAERVKDRAFQRFTELQAGYIQRRDSMNFIIDGWADEAYASAFDVFTIKVRELGSEVLVDTTDTQGYAVIDVPPGDWWVYAYYPQAFSELYWNLPITVERGDPVQVRLTRETADVRPVL